MLIPDHLPDLTALHADNVQAGLQRVVAAAVKTIDGFNGIVGSIGRENGNGGGGNLDMGARQLDVAIAFGHHQLHLAGIARPRVATHAADRGCKGLGVVVFDNIQSNTGDDVLVCPEAEVVLLVETYLVVVGIHILAFYAKVVDDGDAVLLIG